MAAFEMLSLKKLLLCPDCNEEYHKDNDPQVWGCGHTVCLKCTTVRSEDKYRNCPVCSATFLTSTPFPVNISIKNISDFMSSIDTTSVSYGGLNGEIKDELFDEQGFANFGLLTFIKNRLRDRVSSLHKIRDGFVNRVSEVNQFINDFESKIGQLSDWEYTIVSQHSPEDRKRREDMKQYMVNLKCLLKCTEVLSEPLLEKQKMKSLFCSQESFVYYNIEGKDRWGRLNPGENCIFLYAMTMKQEPPEEASRISFQDLISYHDQSRTEVFLDLFWENEVHGRVHLEIFENRDDNLEFVDKCTFGKKGFLKDRPLASVMCLESEYETHEDIDSEASSSDEQNEFCGFEGTIPVFSPCSRLQMCSNKIKYLPHNMFKLSLCSGFAGKSCLGTVTKGLIILKYALLYNDVETVMISDCGLVLREEKKTNLTKP